MQQSNDPRFVNGGFPFKVNGQEFAASAFSDRDYADLTGYIQAKYLEQAKRIGKDAYKFAIAAIGNITWGTNEGFEIIGTNEGTMRVGWQLIRQRHPSIDFEDFKSHFPEKGTPELDDALNNVVEAFNFVHRAEKKDVPADASSKSPA